MKDYFGALTIKFVEIVCGIVLRFYPYHINYKDLRKVSRNKDHYFLQFDFSKNKIKERQGFKIHISATIKNYEQILDIIFNFCKKMKLHLNILPINTN